MSKTLYQQVYNALHKYEECRNSDRRLMIKIWESQGLCLTEQQRQQFMQVSSPESIRRNRQKLNEAGYFLPSENIRKFRKELAGKQTAEIVQTKQVQELLAWIDK